jgi:ketosteroid isomerase-like protein
MSAAENVAVMLRWFDAVNAHDLDRLAALLADGFVWDAGSRSGLGVQSTTAAWRALFSVWGAQMRSSSTRVLMKQSAEPIAPLNT